MSETNHKTKIFLSYHKPSVLLSDDVFCPIHVGRVMHEITPDSWLAQNLIGDDTGDNISNKNANYCELTAQYWAWKNYDKLGNPDYIGLMHYRRHLIMRAGELDVVHFEELDEENYLKEYYEIYEEKIPLLTK